MTNAKRTSRRLRFTVADNCGSNRGETKSRNRTAARCSDRANKSVRTGIASSPQNQTGAPKLISKKILDTRSLILDQKIQHPESSIENRPTLTCVRSTSSWQFFPHGLRQQKLCDQQTTSTHDANRKQIAILLIFFDGDR